MILPIEITSTELIKCFRHIKSLLNGNDQVVFDAMVVVAGETGIVFQAPRSVGEYSQKHEEIENRLRRAILRGTEVGITLIDEIAVRVKSGDAQGVAFDDLLDQVNMTTNHDFELFLSPNLVWSARWKKENIILGVYERSNGEVVPSYVFEYINNAIISYKNGLNFAAAAMISIVVEATLRDMLIARGYKYIPRATSVDVYKTVRAQVTSDNNNFILSFPHSAPTIRSVGDFYTATQGQTFDIEIRRAIKDKKPGQQRIDLQIVNPTPLIEYWSTDEIQTEAQKSIGGLNAALETARKEGILTSNDLPEDFDKLICTIRNNLIHLSEEALDTSLSGFPPPKNTLIGFLQDPQMIVDLIDYVTLFVNQKYQMLKLGIT